MSHFITRIQILVAIVLLLMINDFASAQNDFSSIEYSKIKQSKIKKLIEHQQSQEILKLSDLEASVHPQTNLNDFLHYEKEYLIKENIDEVWYNYDYSNQTEVWDISKISFGMIYCRDSESVIYADEMLFGLEEGRIYYINLKILNGFYNLPVAFEITRVDQQEKVIEFTYMKGGKTRGKQRIQLSENEQGYTTINHQSFVKSGSRIRDKYLYPYFHNKLINEFHVNMKRLIASRSKRRHDQLAELK